MITEDQQAPRGGCERTILIKIIKCSHRLYILTIIVAEYIFARFLKMNGRYIENNKQWSADVLH